MAFFDTHNPLALAFGLLGNLVSFIVFLSPLPTFIRVCKKRSTEGFQSVPYVVGLFSAMAWIYYATLKPDASLLFTINAFGCVIEVIYIGIYVAFAPKQARISTLKLLILLNGGGFCCLLLLSHFISKGPKRLQVLGWVCVSFSVCVFAAPLSIVRMVIRTKSVEFMPFYLSLFLTMNAISWLLYGIALKDLYIAGPNVLGLIFGILQMMLYAKYRKNKTVVKEVKQPEQAIDIAKLSETINSDELQSAGTQTNIDENIEKNNKSVTVPDDHTAHKSVPDDHTAQYRKSLESCNPDPLIRPSEVICV